ncbi:MAG: hypothetical protein ACR2MS_02285 [Weeksellaceae bacterium]
MNGRIEIMKAGLVKGLLSDSVEGWRPDGKYKKVFWGVYLRKSTGLADHLRDFNTESEARFFAKELAEATEIEYDFKLW